MTSNVLGRDNEVIPEKLKQSDCISFNALEDRLADDNEVV